MDKQEYQNKPCYLENRFVREPCKRRTAACSCFCVGIFYVVAAKGLLLVVHTMYSLVAAADAQCAKNACVQI